MIFEMKKKVYGFDCDIYGHLNNANYLKYYEEARSEALDKMDLSLAELKKLGIEIYLKKAEIDYSLGIPFGETILIQSQVSELNKVKSVWQQNITSLDTKILYNSAIITGVFIKNKKPTRVSDKVFNNFKQYL